MSLCGFAFQSPLPCPLSLDDLHRLNDVTDSQQECLLQYQQSCGEFFPLSKQQDAKQTLHCAFATMLAVFIVGWMVKAYYGHAMHKWKSAVRKSYYAICSFVWAMAAVLSFIALTSHDPRESMEHIVINRNHIWLPVIGFMNHFVICSICDCAYYRYFNQDSHMQHRSNIQWIKRGCVTSHLISLFYGIWIYLGLRNNWSIILWAGSWFFLVSYMLIFAYRPSTIHSSKDSSLSLFGRISVTATFLALLLIYNPVDGKNAQFKPFYTNDRYDSAKIVLSVFLIIHFVLTAVMFVMKLSDQWLFVNHHDKHRSKRELYLGQDEAATDQSTPLY